MKDELDPRKPVDPVLLFVRADERIEMIASDQHDLQVAFNEQRHAVEKLSARMEGQVSHTGHKNTADISELQTRVALLEKENNDLRTQIFEADTGVIKQFKDLRDWVRSVNMFAIGFVITGAAGGLILWAVKNFR